MVSGKSSRSLRYLPLSIFFILLWTFVPSTTQIIFAQEPIALDEDKLGDLSGGTPIYLFNGQAGQTVQIQVIAFQQGMVPWFVVQDPAGQTALVANNAEGSSSITGTVTLTQDGNYPIAIFTASGVRGQFVLSVHQVETATATYTPTAILSTPTPILPPTQVATPITGQPPAAGQTFSIQATPTEITLINIQAPGNAAGVTAQLMNSQGQVIASSTTIQTLLTMSIPAGDGLYTLIVTDNNAPPLAINVQVIQSSPEVLAAESTPIPPQPPDTTAPIATEDVEPVATEDVQAPIATENVEPAPVVTEDVNVTATYTPSPILDQQDTAPTATYTPSYTVAAPTATYTPSYTVVAPTVTYTPSYTPTTPPAAQVAPDDARFNNPLTLALDTTGSVTDFVSYPGGDREDRVRFEVTGMNQSPSLSGGRARLILAVSCFGQNTDQVQFFTGGQTYGCGQTIFDQEVTFNSNTGSVVITAVGGEGTYIQWVLTGTATRVN